MAEQGQAGGYQRVCPTPTGERNKCYICNREFARSDSLQRHAQIHNPQRAALKSRRKACTLCARSRIRCSGEVPSCVNCRKKRSSCVYSPATLIGAPIHTPVSGNSVKNYRTELEAPLTVDETAESALLLSSFSECPPSGHGLNLDDIGNLSTKPFPPDSDLSSGQLNFPLFADDSYAFPHTNDLGFQWLFDSNTTLQETSPNEYSYFVQDQASSRTYQQVHEDTVEPRANDGSQGRNEEPNVGTVLPVPTPQDSDCEPSNPWPMEWRAEASQMHYLPELGIDDERVPPRSFEIEEMSVLTWKNLQDSIELATKQGPWRQVSLAVFPDRIRLDYCIDLYFTRFQPLVSILHLPTFNTNKAPAVLILAIITIGSSYSSFERSQKFSYALWELNRRLLWFMAEHDPRFTRTDYYIMAQLMQGIFGISCGDKRIFELSESARSTLVNNAACMGLFKARNPSKSNDNDSLQSRWRTWLNEEALCRLGWAVYAYDSSVCFQLNRRPYSSNSTMELPLPNSHELWEADSAQAWDALHPASKFAPSRQQFRPLLTAFVTTSGQTVANNIRDRQHRRIFLSAYMRMLWTLKEMASSTMQKYKHGFHEYKEDVLKVLEVIRETLPTISITTSNSKALQALIIDLQLLHISQLYGAGDLMDWIFPLLSGGSTSEDLKRRISEWAAENMSRVRSVAYHSAQTLGIIRKFPYNHPMEPFNAFYAGVVLWYMAWILQSGREALGTCGTYKDVHIRLDQLSSVTGNSPSVAENSSVIPSGILDLWIKDPPAIGLVPVGIHGVPDITDAAGPQQILQELTEILDRMQTWGIAQKFRSTALRLVKPEWLTCRDY